MKKILHGEAIISTSKLPKNAKKVTKGTSHIIADSETIIEIYISDKPRT